MKTFDYEQGSDDWFSIRAGKPTASNFKKLITSTGAPSTSMQAYAIELAGEAYAGKPLDTWNGNKFTEYGQEIEGEARLAYEMRTGQEVEQTGFITDDMEQYGCSPDGLTDNGGMVEIKCLPKAHIPALLYWKKNAKPPTDYIAQVQGQLFVTGREWCDLTFYRPDLPMLIIRIEPDQKIMDSLEQQIMACIAERDIILKALMEF